MNSHDIAERTSLLAHRIYAEKISEQPEMLLVAKDRLQRCIKEQGGTLGQKLWIRILRRTWPEVREKMLADDQYGRLLRSNSPFSMMLGVTDPEQRRQLWRQANSELSLNKTSSEQHVG